MVNLTQYHTEIHNRGVRNFPSIPHAPIPEVALYVEFEFHTLSLSYVNLVLFI